MVTTVLNPGPQFESFLRYHLASGFERIYVFFDDPHDSSINVAKRIKGVKAIPCDAKTRRRWKSLQVYRQIKDTINKTYLTRQTLNANLGRDMALNEKFDWIFHVDCDELVYNSWNRPIGKFMSEIPEDVDQVILQNHEIVPQRMDVENPFVEITLFKKNLATFGKVAKWRQKIFNHYFNKAGRIYFFAYFVGKAAARVKPNIFPLEAAVWKCTILAGEPGAGVPDSPV
jgi:hypothetical protein